MERINWILHFIQFRASSRTSQLHSSHCAVKTMIANLQVFEPPDNVLQSYCDNRVIFVEQSIYSKGGLNIFRMVDLFLFQLSFFIVENTVYVNEEIALQHCNCYAIDRQIVVIKQLCSCCRHALFKK